MLQTLHTFLPLARKVHNKRTKLPVLHHACVENGFLRMTDTETTVFMPVPDDRRYTFPVTVMYQVLKTKPESLDIAVLTSGDTIQVTYNQHQVECPTFDPDEYPSVSGGTFQHLGTWQPETFRLLKEQGPFTSNDDQKPALNGVWVAQNGVLESCASDGKVLKYYPALQPDDSVSSEIVFEGIIPEQALKLLDRFVTEPVQVSANGETMRFELADDITIYVQLINERFPDFKPLLSFDDRRTLDVTKDGFLEAVQSAKPFANKHTRKGVASIRESQIQLTVDNPESKTEFETSVPVSNHKGDGIPIGWNLLLLERLLKPIESETIRLHYKSGIAATLMTDPSLNVTGPVSLLMPIRLEEKEK